jgi:hypothetical protein
LESRDEAVDNGVAATRGSGDEPAKGVHHGKVEHPRPDLAALQREAQIAGERAGEVAR